MHCIGHLTSWSLSYFIGKAELMMLSLSIVRDCERVETVLRDGISGAMQQ
jgi:hypothetical protein